MLDVSVQPIDALLRERRSIRLFRSEEIPRRLVDDMLAAALWAPSPHHSQPWRLSVISSPEVRSRLATVMAEQLASEMTVDGFGKEQVTRQTSRSVGRIVEAPLVVLCSLVHEGLAKFPDPRRNALEREMAVQSVGALLQSLFLVAHARGIGSCWMAAPMYCPGVVRSTLNLPETYEPQALALLGYAAHPGRLRDRKPIEEVVQHL